MLFHRWIFLIFLAVVLPGYFALRRTKMWIPWLLAASYFFYAWWNPLYLLLVIYSTLLDYLLVTLMDHCPPAHRLIQTAIPDRNGKRPADRVLILAMYGFGSLAALLVAAAVFGSARLRPTFVAFAVLVSLMALGAKMRSRFAWLLISIFNNLALLMFFKYARFVEVNLNAVLHAMHFSVSFPDPSVLMPPKWEYLLPVGISFFTFQSMSYTIDFYLGKVARERNILRFATFVCFFPQLMAGPIERAKQMLPQLQAAPRFRMLNLTDGMSLFLVGLFKKLALADYLAIYVDRVYDNPGAFNATALALATFAFAWQIFFDFSGYTDMARSVAKMMGFDLVLNFNNPYVATSLGDFWARWHISLSTWFRDYVYIPLGGNRRGLFNTYRNLLITFVISGIWHGANWSFAIWGALHAVGVVLTRELERSAFYRERIPTAFKRAWVFAYVCFAWIFFRASNLADASLIVSRIFATAWTTPQIPLLMLVLIVSVWVYQSIYETRFRGVLRLSAVRVGLAVAMILYISLCSTRGGAFIYFQF